jgi:hypothetical protein
VFSVAVVSADDTRRFHMRNDNLAQSWITIAGIALVAAGLLGFVNNPIVGPANAVFATGTVHNIVHVLTGALALYIAFGLKGEMQANAVIGFGILYAVIFVALLVSANLFGLFEYPVNVGDHVLHIGVSLISLAVGWMARTSAMRTQTPSMSR